MNPYSLRKTPSIVQMETAVRHKALRKKLKLTQPDLAERAGMSLGSLKRFEQTGQIAFESLLKLAHVLGRLADFDPIFSVDTALEEAERLFSDKTRRV